MLGFWIMLVAGILMTFPCDELPRGAGPREIGQERITADGGSHKGDETLDATTIEPDHHVIWTGKTMRLTRVCDSVDCEYAYQTLRGEPVAFPPDIKDIFTWGFASTISPDESFFVYVDKMTMYTLPVATMKPKRLFSLYDDTDGYDFMGWSPTGNKVAFVAINQNTAAAGGHADYPNATKLFILAFEKGEMISKEKYNLDIAWTCGGRCFAHRGALTWLDDDAIEYATQKDLYSGDYGDEVVDLPRHRQALR